MAAAIAGALLVGNLLVGPSTPRLVHEAAQRIVSTSDERAWSRVLAQGGVVEFVRDRGAQEDAPEKVSQPPAQESAKPRQENDNDVEPIDVYLRVQGLGPLSPEDAAKVRQSLLDSVRMWEKTVLYLDSLPTATPFQRAEALEGLEQARAMLRAFERGQYWTIPPPTPLLTGTDTMGVVLTGLFAKVRGRDVEVVIPYFFEDEPELAAAEKAFLAFWKREGFIRAEAFNDWPEEERRRRWNEYLEASRTYERIRALPPPRTKRERIIRQKELNKAREAMIEWVWRLRFHRFDPRTALLVQR